MQQTPSHYLRSTRDVLISLPCLRTIAIGLPPERMMAARRRPTDRLEINGVLFTSDTDSSSLSDSLTTRGGGTVVVGCVPAPPTLLLLLLLVVVVGAPPPLPPPPPTLLLFLQFDRFLPVTWPTFCIAWPLHVCPASCTSTRCTLSFAWSRHCRTERTENYRVAV